MTALSLTRAEFADLADADAPVVVRASAELDVDAEPLTAYAALAAGDYSFLLESAEKTASSDPAGAFSARPSGQRHARYSFVGYDPDALVSVFPDEVRVDHLRSRAAEALGVEPGARTGDADALDVLRNALSTVERAGFDDAAHHLEGGLVGFLAYDAVYDLWLADRVERPAPAMPDAQFVLTTRTVVFDHAEGSASVAFTPVVRPGDDPSALYDDLLAEADRIETLLAEAETPETGGFVREGDAAGSRAEYETAVRRAKEHVLDGDIYQGVISRTRELTGAVDPLGLYESLRAVNPSPYMYLLAHGDRTVVGASPETLVSVRGREVTSNPIAGTCARGESPVEDRRYAGEMLADGKERAEHTMLVDLARNDVRRVSEPGSVTVEEFMNVLKYSHVQHIESTVTGRLAADRDAFDATRAAFPAGTLSGAPKIRAMEIINELEAEPRGIYGGGVGYYSWTGDADFAIVIRTATIERDEGRGSSPPDRITVRAGAGIVADSEPASEFEETEKKMGGVVAALDRIEVEPPELVR